MAKKKEVSAKEKINDQITALDEAVGVCISEWERYYFDGVKKGFKEARKAVLEAKKQAALIRKTMKEMDV